MLLTSNGLWPEMLLNIPVHRTASMAKNYPAQNVTVMRLWIRESSMFSRIEPSFTCVASFQVHLDNEDSLLETFQSPVVFRGEIYLVLWEEHPAFCGFLLK